MSSLDKELYNISQSQKQILEELIHIRGDISDITFGQRCADNIVRWIGSWIFIISQAAVLMLWVVLNVYKILPFDQFPFQFLNLLLSFQAAFAVPIILMAQNRQEHKDRGRAVEAYRAIDRIENLMIVLDGNVDRTKRNQENGK